MAAMAALSLAPALASAPSLRLAPCTITRSSSFSSVRAAPLRATALTTETSSRLHAALGAFKQAPQRRRFRCQAESVDENDVVAAGERKVSEVKEQVSEGQGPPLLTIIAGVFVAAVVIWGLWSLISAILRIFFH